MDLVRWIAPPYVDRLSGYGCSARPGGGELPIGLQIMDRFWEDATPDRVRGSSWHERWAGLWPAGVWGLRASLETTDVKGLSRRMAPSSVFCKCSF